jgi:hypothetical protein
MLSAPSRARSSCSSRSTTTASEIHTSSRCEHISSWNPLSEASVFRRCPRTSGHGPSESRFAAQEQRAGHAAWRQSPLAFARGASPSLRNGFRPRWAPRRRSLAASWPPVQESGSFCWLVKPLKDAQSCRRGPCWRSGPDHALGCAASKYHDSERTLSS